MQFLRKPSVQSPEEAAKALVREGPVAKAFPAVLEFLTAVQWAPGEPRKPGTLTIFTDDGLWKASLNDKDADRSAFVSAASPELCLVALEKGLRDDTLTWRSWGGSNGRRRK